MSGQADRTMPSRLVDAYDRIPEVSLGMVDPEFHEIEDQLFDAIDYGTKPCAGLFFSELKRVKSS
jgi:hypothetical protein